MAALLARSKLTFAAQAAAPRRAVRPTSMVVRASAQQEQTSSLVKPAVATVVANVIMAMPAAAEAGKLFDFNLTLPVMAGQFLLLMVFLDKFWFTPVGKVLDERDGVIREKLSSVKDNTGDVDKLAAEAQEILKAARSEVTAMINSQKSAKQAELDKQYAEAKAKITAEMEAGVKAMEAESKAMLTKLDAQVEKISNEVLRRVLPESVRI